MIDWVPGLVNRRRRLEGLRKDITVVSVLVRADPRRQMTLPLYIRAGGSAAIDAYRAPPRHGESHDTLRFGGSLPAPSSSEHEGSANPIESHPPGLISFSPLLYPVSLHSEPIGWCHEERHLTPLTL